MRKDMPVIDKRNQVFCLIHFIQTDPKRFPVIGNSDKQEPSVTVCKSNDRLRPFHRVLRIQHGFKFTGNVFGNDIGKQFAHFHPSFLLSHEDITHCKTLQEHCEKIVLD